MAVTVEFLEARGFKRVQCEDGIYLVRHFTSEYFLQASFTLDEFTEYDNEFIEELSAAEFVATIERHDKAINQ